MYIDGEDVDLSCRQLKLQSIDNVLIQAPAIKFSETDVGAVFNLVFHGDVLLNQLM